jgi:hypothetical protein
MNLFLNTFVQLTNKSINYTGCDNGGSGAFCCVNGADNADCCENGGSGSFCCVNGANNADCNFEL